MDCHYRLITICTCSELQIEPEVHKCFPSVLNVLIKTFSMTRYLKMFGYVQHTSYIYI